MTRPPKPGSKEPGERCNAATKGGRNCLQLAGAGTDHVGIGRCGWHGGKSPGYAVKLGVDALKRQAVDKVIYGDQAAVNPYEALLSEVAWSFGHVSWLRERVQEAREAADVLSVQRQWLSLYRGERKHLAAVAKMAIDSNVADRLTSLLEQNARQYARTVRDAAERIGLDASQRRALMLEIAADLRGASTETPALSPAPIETTVIETTASEPEPDPEPDDAVPPWEAPRPLPCNVRVLV